MVPAEIAFGVGTELQHRGIEVRERLKDNALRNALKINLRRNDDQDAEDQRQQ